MKKPATSLEISAAHHSKAALSLVLASIFWGLGFIVTQKTLDTMSPHWITVWRFFIAGVVSMVIYTFNGHSVSSALTHSQFLNAVRQSMRHSMKPGIFLGITLILQNAGLKYTSTTNSAFITALYALFVPFSAYFFLKKSLRTYQIICALFGLLGTTLICTQNFTPHFNLGDLMTFVCAWTATIQILLIDASAKLDLDPVLFNGTQCLWASATALTVAIFSGHTFQLPSGMTTWTVIIFLGLFCSLFAFLAQIKAQKIISASTASMLFLLESPFCALFSYILLDEHLSTTQWMGAALILTASFASVRLEESPEFLEKPEFDPDFDKEEHSKLGMTP